MDLTSTSSNWIYAYKAGSAINSDSVSASISQHDQYGTFTLNLAAATGGDGTMNPFTTAATAASNTGMSSLNNDNSTMNSTMADTSDSNAQMIMDGTTAHGIMGAAAFVVLFPSGSIVMRIFNFKGVMWLHVGIQIFGYLVALALMETGVWIALNNGEVRATAPVCYMTLIRLDDGYASYPWLGRRLRALLPAFPGHRTPCTL
jgi:hypothetical protein